MNPTTVGCKHFLSDTANINEYFVNLSVESKSLVQYYTC